MPPSLRPDTPLGLKRADDTWNAVEAPSDWGRLTLDALGEHAGAVLEDAVFRRLVWFVPPGGIDDWPAPASLRLTLYRAGDELLVPQWSGYKGMNTWLRTPATGLFTDPEALRSAMEEVVGPLDEADRADFVVVCHFCATPTRDAEVIDRRESENGRLYRRYACSPCLRATGGDRVHLLGHQRGPQ
ncbi:hypothetical protein [Streptomyces sp. NEAU-YJ-81]|uniref:hypothetical protein n=1 Tax=Streptomyces sp. NEAU-YJ-81 TaxID=2820288 RepID=UPI001ABBFD5B|nr:hypothetical protein [Streptomyces sp. NEAU-YJ-81]MBO3682714.1 hypothetical protein [Streptomyces sp. NEAU-YJ-81]